MAVYYQEQKGKSIIFPPITEKRKENQCLVYFL